MISTFTKAQILGFLLVCFCPLLIGNLSAQTLAPGDLTITAYQSDSPEAIGFVATTDIPGGTVVLFTDNGWTAAGAFRANEGVISWTVPTGAGLSCGDEFTLLDGVVVDDQGANSGTTTNVSGSLILSGGGDQFFIYQENAAGDVNFIAGLQANGDWDADATSSNESAQPADLTGNNTSLALIPEVDNGIYDGSTLTGDRDALLAAINTLDNWTVSNDVLFETAVSFGFTCEMADMCDEDTTPPTIECSDITVALDSMGMAMIENGTAVDTIFDNCAMDLAGPFTMGGPAARTFDCSLADSTVTRTVVASDTSGNQGSCDYMVTIIDTIAPVLFCFDITVALDSMGNAMIENDTALDSIVEACGMDLAGPFTMGGPGARTFDCSFADSTVTRTVVATDVNGNQGSCTYQVSVIDTIAPILLCQDITVFIDEEGTASVTDTTLAILSLSDNCTDSTDITVALVAPVLGCDGATGTATLTATDAFGNAAVCSIGLQPVDTIAPVAICQDVTVELNAMGVATTTAASINNASTDNCALQGLTLALDVTDFDCDDIGANTVTLTVTDASGTAATCTATVTVEDNIAPVVMTFNQSIILNDANVTRTLNINTLVTATDNCDDADITFSADRSLRFTSDDIGTNNVTITVTDGNGNVTVVTVAVVVGFDQPNLACISRINLTLNEDCQALLIPRMVLTGNTGLLDAFNFDVTVMDDDPSNGPIIDGCGRFNYRITSSDDSGSATNGFTGDFSEDNWEVTLSGNQASATFTDETLTLTSGAVPDNDFTATDDVSVSYQFDESGTVSFDFDYILDADIIVDLFIIDFDGNIVFQSDDIDVSGAETGSGTITQDVMPGSTLVIMIDGDEFTTSGIISEVVISNFSFVTGALLGLDFETCWGIVNAEDKTPPAVTALPVAPALFCTEINDVELASLASNISRCWSVTNTGAFISYRANFQSQPVTNLNRFLTQTELGRRLVRGGGLPTATDGCSETLEICVNDVIQRDPLDPQCNDVLVTRRFTVTETGSCNSAAGEDNDSTTDDYVLTFVRPDLDDLDGDAIDAVAEYECDDPTIVFGTNPAPRVQDFPFLEVDGRIFPLSDGANGQTVCNIGVTFSDGRRIVTCPNTYKFVRTYTVIDWCEPGDVRTFTQVVKVGDTQAPTFTGPRQFDFQGNELDGLTFSTNAGNICAAYIRLDDPTIRVADNCSANVFITANIYPNGNLTATPIGTFVVDLNDGNAEISSAIPAGDHVLRYIVRDDCGNQEEFDFDFSVVDRTAPVAICEDGLNISITAGQSQTGRTGIAVLTPAHDRQRQLRRL